MFDRTTLALVLRGDDPRLSPADAHRIFTPLVTSNFEDIAWPMTWPKTPKAIRPKTLKFRRSGHRRIFCDLCDRSFIHISRHMQAHLLHKHQIDLEMFEYSHNTLKAITYVRRVLATDMIGGVQ